LRGDDTVSIVGRYATRESSDAVRLAKTRRSR